MELYTIESKLGQTIELVYRVYIFIFPFSNFPFFINVDRYMCVCVCKLVFCSDSSCKMPCVTLQPANHHRIQNKRWIKIKTADINLKMFSHFYGIKWILLFLFEFRQYGGWVINHLNHYYSVRTMPISVQRPTLTDLIMLHPIGRISWMLNITDCKWALN